jgi:hypothetical protein
MEMRTREERRRSRKARESETTNELSIADLEVSVHSLLEVCGLLE